MNLEFIRKDFPILKKLTYLDSASTSLTPNQVIESINSYYTDFNANTGRGAYKIAIKATEKLEETRGKISKFINSKPKEIIFTKNTTEGINTIANGLKFNFNDNIIISDIEHHSNYIPWLNLEKQSKNNKDNENTKNNKNNKDNKDNKDRKNNENLEVKIAKSDENGIINPSSIEELVDENTKLIAISHVSNAIGSLQPIEEISKITKKNNSYFLLDVAQSIGHMIVDNKKINADFIAAPGHKGLLGPIGTGFLYIKEEIANEISPLNLGGGTITNIENKDFTLEEVPYRFEAGTQNIAGIIGLNRGIDYINKIDLKKIEKESNILTKTLYEGLSEIKNLKIYGNKENISNIVSFNINNANPHEVAKILDENYNICVRSGFHCAIPAIKAINAEYGTVRASIHCYNTLEDIDKLIDSTKKIAKFYD